MCSFLSFCSLQMDRVLNKCTETVRQRGRMLWGRPFCMIIITKATKSKSKKQFQHGVRIGFFSATQPLHTASNWGKTQDTSDSWDAYERNVFSEPRLSHLLMYRKVLKFLNLRYLVFFNSQKYFWCSDYRPLVANFYIIWLLPTSCLLRAVLSGLLEMRSPTFEVRKIPTE